MSNEDARKVASILIHADGGCSNCVSDLGERAREAFPDIKWGKLMSEAWQTEQHWRDNEPDRWIWLDG